MAIVSLARTIFAPVAAVVASQHLYDQLLAASPAELDDETSFTRLCQDLLRAEFAQLTPLGPLAPLMQPLHYPAQAPPSTYPGNCWPTFDRPRIRATGLARIDGLFRCGARGD
ncbi:MAG: hypothetical protein H6633_00135 [Anaerolineales bacterium]|nr:hypothetical protein [Anaerolineales bacterium]